MIVDRYAEGIEKLTGVAPMTCPWRTFRDPFVASVMEASRACSGEETVPALLLELDLPHAVWQGLLHFVSVRERVRADRRRSEREAHERKAKARG